ncbi:MAG: transcription termination/antitermination protein NusG [bacterium]
MSEKQWFVLHTLTGQEAKVKESIERRLDKEEMRAYVDQVLIPTEKVSETKKGVKSVITRKFFPGYVLVSMSLYGDDRKVIETVWYFIRETPGVIGFVGGERPAPLRPDEVERLLFQVEEKKEKVKPKVIYDIGETVKINDGPFMNFTGTVDEVDAERGKLKVSVAIFGRSAPVELEYWQVERQ